MIIKNKYWKVTTYYSSSKFLIFEFEILKGATTL